MSNWINEIKKRTEKVPTASGRSNKLGKISFNDLVFLPPPLTKKPVDYFSEQISSKTIIGKTSQKQIELKIPLIVAAMSFGALSKEAKIALAKASTIAGTIANTGEGGSPAEERQFANLLIAQYSTGRFGVDESYLKNANAIEIKIGQGAKPGQGGLLPKEKITDEISQIRNVPKTQDVHSPPSHPDINSIEDLKNKVQYLKDLTQGSPIIIKLGAGHVEQDIKLAVQANPDIIAIDGMEGGTGAAPEVMLDDVGLPTLAALTKARSTLDNLSAKQELWIAGGLSKGADMAKALALGADAIFLGFPLMVAMGCTYCRQCYLGNCPRGVATQNPELTKKLDIDQASTNASNFLKNCTEEIKMIAGATGKPNIHDLNKQDLKALNSDIAKITGIDLV